jgi:hypothetical protein
MKMVKTFFFFLYMFSSPTFARSDKGWRDLEQSAKIPLDILDPAESAAAEDEVIDMVPLS